MVEFKKNDSREILYLVILAYPIKAVYYTVVVHVFNLQEKTTSTVDKDNESV